VSKRRYYNFDSFRVDPTERVLLRDGRPISLSPKVFDTLLALVERNGHIVSKDVLVEIVWPDVFVEENNLTQYVAAARLALGANRQEQRYIETVPKRGYRFVSSVQVVTEESDSVIVEEQESLRIVVKDKIEEQEVTANARSYRWLAPAVLAGVVLLSVTAIVAIRFRASIETRVQRYSDRSASTNGPPYSMVLVRVCNAWDCGSVIFTARSAGGIQSRQ